MLLTLEITAGLSLKCQVTEPENSQFEKEKDLLLLRQKVTLSKYSLVKPGLIITCLIIIVINKIRIGLSKDWSVKLWGKITDNLILLFSNFSDPVLPSRSETVALSNDVGKIKTELRDILTVSSEFVVLSEVIPY